MKRIAQCFRSRFLNEIAEFRVLHSRIWGSRQKSGRPPWDRKKRDLVDWYDNRERSFHEAFRFRVKIESVFSHLKRLSDGYCWSRGRRRTTKNADEPCDAWVNELLCKFIYINLRSTDT